MSMFRAERSATGFISEGEMLLAFRRSLPPIPDSSFSPGYSFSGLSPRSPVIHGYPKTPLLLRPDAAKEITTENPSRADESRGRNQILLCCLAASTAGQAPSIAPGLGCSIQQAGRNRRSRRRIRSEIQEMGAFAALRCRFEVPWGPETGNTSRET
jgi:hypothetical protein